MERLVRRSGVGERAIDVDGHAPCFGVIDLVAMREESSLDLRHSAGKKSIARRCLPPLLRRVDGILQIADKLRWLPATHSTTTDHPELIAVAKCHAAWAIGRA